MGYQRLEENDEEVLEAFYRGKVPVSDGMIPAYPYQIRKMLRNFWVKKSGNYYEITDRGKNVFQQHRRDGRFWVMPLKTYKAVHVSASKDGRRAHRRSRPRKRF